MKRAWCDIREKPHYRSEAFFAGLERAGFKVNLRELPGTPPGPGDILVIWNKYSDRERTANTWEKQGGTVIVAENGYCGRDANGHQLYALAIHGHNGSGRWPDGGPERWQDLGIALSPWRDPGEHVLVCPNRHFGPKGLAMPLGWEKDIVAELKKRTRRRIIVRPHPNGDPPATPLADDLRAAHRVVIWASSAGVHALIAGVPVVAVSPWWICKGAALALDQIEVRPDEHASAARLRALHRLAWAQWTVAEIASGEPFVRLLNDENRSLP